MNIHAIYHRPTSEYAFDKIYCMYGDKYNWNWNFIEKSEIFKVVTDELFDYWEIEVKVKNRRLCYGFVIHDDHIKLWMTERGYFNDIPNEVLNNFQYGLFEFPYIHK